MPLLRLDVGRLFAGLGWERAKARTREHDPPGRSDGTPACSGSNAKIDQGASVGDSRSDGGASQRVLASLLTWMAEKTTAVFVVATANGVANLPPELMRKGASTRSFCSICPMRPSGAPSWICSCAAAVPPMRSP